MSALDRAIIKAYHRPVPRGEKGAQAAPALHVPAAAAIAETPAPTAAMSAAVPLSRALADLAAQANVAPAQPVSTSLSALLDEALQQESPAVPPRPASVPSAPPRVQVAAAADTNTRATRDHKPASATENITLPSAAVKTWSPMLQVDRVVWPTIHNRLQGAAQAAVAQMADGLQAIADAGRKIIGLASCRRGEGVTTLLSAAARNLLAQGRKVVLVDNHWSNPQLARCLGLLPQIGWEESLSGRLPLQEIVIESLADGLAVLPVREPPASVVTKAAVAASLETLAREFDLVLVDLGPLQEIEDRSTPAHEVAARMDAVILVQNVRITPPHRLTEVRNRLTAAKMPYAGTIQNFVAG